MALVGLLAAVVAVLGIDARSTYGARVSSDEPQYLLTAISLAEDLDLDVSDEIADQRYRDFHEVTLDPQTTALNDGGQELSPHDPLLPALLAIPVRLAGWVGAKLALAVVVGITAALTLFAAHRRYGVSAPVATWVVIGFFASPPLTSYGSQIYPAAPAALAVVAGTLAVTAQAGRGADLAALASIVALPWLSVKHVPVAAVLAVALLWAGRADRHRLAWRTAILAAAALVYVVAHHRIYGGWTVYAAGDHFVDGELGVLGSDPDYLGRSRRLVGLLVDRGFGLAAWTPAFLALPAALAALARRRRPETVLLLAVVGAGWATATWAAATMHGWWWPGRQVVAVLPLAVVAIAAWADGSGRRLAAVVTGTALGALTWLWLVWEASTGRRTIIVDFEQTAAPWYRLWRPLLPDLRAPDAADALLTVAWVAVLVALVVGAWLASATGRRAVAARPEPGAR